MKRILSFILIVVLMLSVVPAFAEAADTGIWERRAYVDEFDLPTDEYYMAVYESISYFSEGCIS